MFIIPLFFQTQRRRKKKKAAKTSESTSDPETGEISEAAAPDVITSDSAEAQVS